jgi:hypothetical protein
MVRFNPNADFRFRRRKSSKNSAFYELFTMLMQIEMSASIEFRTLTTSAVFAVVTPATALRILDDRGPYVSMTFGEETHRDWVVPNEESALLLSGGVGCAILGHAQWDQH